MISLTPLPAIPEISRGDDIAELLTQSLALVNIHPQNGDVLVIAHKVISKAEGQTRFLPEITPSDDAQHLATEVNKDPRLVEVVIQESKQIIRAEHGHLICRTNHGFVCANAGVDASNSGQDDTVVLLPRNPDHSAQKLRHEIERLTGIRFGIIITDSFGRPWRMGQVEVAIGCAGFQPLSDLRGQPDNHGRTLNATVIAIADEAAAAADLTRTKTSREPAVLIRGLSHYVSGTKSPGAVTLQRPVENDLFS